MKREYGYKVMDGFYMIKFNFYFNSKLLILELTNFRKHKFTSRSLYFIYKNLSFKELHTPLIKYTKSNKKQQFTKFVGSFKCLL